MANREKGEVALTVGERTFTLVLKTHAMACIEDHLSTPEREVTFQQFWGRVLRGSVRATTILFWGMLQKYHPEITPDRAFEMIDEIGGLPGFEKVLLSAKHSSTPDPEDVQELEVKGAKKKRPLKARATTGSGGDSTAARVPLA